MLAPSGAWGCSAAAVAAVAFPPEEEVTKPMSGLKFATPVGTGAGAGNPVWGTITG